MSEFTDSSDVLAAQKSPRTTVKHPKDRKHAPETTGLGEGTAKRNIMRRSRDPERDKKQGGGHKGKWETLDDGTTVQVEVTPDDPAYAEEQEEDGSDVVFDEEGSIVMPLSEFKAKIQDIIKEFFVSEDFDEVERSIVELRSPMYHYELVKRAISMSLDEKEKERELVSRLLSALYPKVVNAETMGKGFQRLFELVDELALDAPNAPKDIAAFLARAVVDEILPPAYLSDPLIIGLGGEIVERAKLLLSRDHMGARLERVWGPGDGRAVEDLKVSVDQLLLEYLLSRQLEEASRCVRELSVPHFHHEIVKRAVVTAIDKSEEDRQAMSSLLAYLQANEVISTAQLQKGFSRLVDLMPDLVLDAPTAPKVLTAFINQGIDDGYLPADFPKPDVPNHNSS